MNDLYTLIASEVAKANLAELYLIAGVGFGMSSAPVEVRHITNQAQAGFDGSAFDLLSEHMAIAVGESEASNELDGFTGVRHFESCKVAFEVEKISQFPETYRVLFSRTPSIQDPAA